MKKRLFLIISLVLVITITLGSTYAYFSIQKNFGENIVEVGAKTLSLEFSDGPTIDISNILPGATIIKKFSVENKGTETVFYGLSLDDVTNEFERKQDITLSLSSTNDGGIITETQYPNIDGTIVSYIVIPQGVKQDYTLTIRYKNEATDQSVDMNKKITGTITAVNSEEAYNLAGIAFDNNGNLLTSGLVEVHSDIITAPINSDGTYILENVPVGVHEILFKDDDDNVVVEDNFTLAKNHQEQISEKTIVGSTNKTIAIEVELEEEVIHQIRQQSSLHGVTVLVNNGFPATGSFAVYDTRNITTTVTPEEHYGYNETNGSRVVCTNGQTGVINNNQLVINNITDDTTCTVTFTRIKHDVNFVVNNGTSANQSASVNYGDTASTTITANTGYTLSNADIICTNGQTASISGTTLTTGAMTSNSTCSVILPKDKRTVSFVVNNGTSSVPSSTIDYGSTASATITPNSGYRLDGANVVCTNDQAASINKSLVTTGSITSNTTCTISLAAKIWDLTLDSNGNGKADFGDMIKIGTESFHVVSNDNTNIKALAQYNLYVGGESYGYYANSYIQYNNPTGLQNDAMRGYDTYNNYGYTHTGVVPFSSTNYWHTSSTYPVWVYDGDNNVRPHVEVYKTTLENLGANIVEARVLSIEEIEALGCIKSGAFHYCDTAHGGTAPEWLYYHGYWLGSAVGTNLVAYMSRAGYTHEQAYYDEMYSVRPLITIPANEV